MKKILFVDHFDSFSFNLINIFLQHGFCVKITHANDSRLENSSFLKQFQACILSPGPGHPRQYPNTIQLYKNYGMQMPFIGICLGHQIMLHSLGAKIKKVTSIPEHGRQINLSKQIKSKHLGAFKVSGSIVLYNSLGCFSDDVQFNNQFNSLLTDGQVCLMAEHKLLPHVGVQFHPESFASTAGSKLLTQIIRCLL